MKPILILYATREGHTRTISEHIADSIRARDIDVVLRDVNEIVRGDDTDLDDYSAALLAASVHAGRHEPDMARFVEGARDALERMPTAFLSVSLTEAGAEDASRTPEGRAEAGANAAAMMDRFFERTGWHPARAQPVAGALMYSKYNLVVRWVMKRIARKEGASTDTSKDHVFTNWEALDGFVAELVDELVDQAGARDD